VLFSRTQHNQKGEREREREGEREDGLLSSLAQYSLP
jgi:hypothetical protein